MSTRSKKKANPPSLGPDTLLSATMETAPETPTPMSTKRMRANTTTQSNEPQKRGRQNMTPRDPLPDRANRVQNPGAPDQKAGRRTSTQVEKDKKKQEALQMEIDQLRREKKELLAQRELEEEMNDEREAISSVNNLSEVFQLPTPDDDVAQEDLVTTTNKKTRKKKAGRGETRKEVEAMKAELRTNQATVKIDSNKSVTIKIGRPPQSSGLVNGWTPSVGTTISGSGERTVTPTEVKLSEPIGGLTDSDIQDAGEDVQALSSEKKPMWDNTLIAMNEHFENELTMAETPAKANNHKTGRIPVKREDSLSSASDVSSRAVQIPMPDIIKGDWSTRFIPTLYHYLLCSRNPFDDFLGSRAIIAIQRVVNMLATDGDVRVTLNSEIYRKALERCNELRSRIGSQAMKMVKKFIEESNYTPVEIERYVIWALHPDGPLFNRIPVPQEEILTSIATGIPPSSTRRDFFESQMIIEIVKPALRCIPVSLGVKTFGEPKAAFALAAAALERAFSCYKTGSFKDPKPFGNDQVKSAVQDYMENCERFTDRRWKALKTACGIEPEMLVDVNMAETSGILVGRRRSMYVASSPPPE
ncbi:hypothetical protein H0H93_002761 [Arthromyces matolae]|nr:hypothetical protein H0H93_002761 [Arthromyces matolae]